MGIRFGSGLGLLLTIVLWGSTPALGQGEDAPADTTAIPIPGITVTGSRTPEDPLKTPAAISVIPRSGYEMTRQISMADALDRVPGVFTQSRAGAQDLRITIRGYGARGNGERSNAGSMRGIRVMTDGIPLTEPDGRTSVDLIDLGGSSQVEVLRSNGSVLYGNASGGVVNLRTAFDFEHPTTEFQGRGGSFGFHREQGIVGYVIGTAGGSVSAFNSNFDGWREHSQSSTTSIQNRLSSPIGTETQLGLLLDFVSNFNRYPGALTQAQLDADPQQANPAYVARDERRFNRVGRVGVTLEHELTEAQRLSIASWVEPKALQRSERNRFRDFTRYHVGGSATWQLKTAMGSNWRAIWSAGGDEQYQDGAIQFYNLESDGSRGTNLIANKREGANSAGAFAQGELRMGEQWSFRLAARYDNLWYLSEDRIDPSLNATKHFTQVTPKGSIARYFSRHTVYASIGGGVEAPAFNEIDPPPPYDTLTSLNPFLEPMLSTSYELGAKGTLAKQARFGSLDYDAALYWIEVTNDIVPFDGGAYFFTAGKSRRRGGELGLTWTPMTRLTLSGAVSVSDNEYLDYVNDLGDFSGNEVAGLPSDFADAEARVRLLPGLTLAGRVKHVGEYFADDANSASVDAFVLLGGQIEYKRSLSFGAMRLFVAVDNLTDEDYVASAFINGINGEYYEPGLPRNVSAGLNFSIGRGSD